MEREREREIARLVDRRFKILNKLYPDSEFNITKLADETELDHGNISRYIDELEREKLVTTREEKRDKGKPYRHCRLTDKCRRIFDAVVNAAQPEPKELEKPDFEWVEFLIGMICPPARSSTVSTESGTPESPPSEEALKEALNDFHRLCQTTRIWEFKAPKQDEKNKVPKKQGGRGKAPKKQGERDDIWSFFERVLESGACLPEIMSDLRVIVINALGEKRKNVIDRIRETFANKIEGIATTLDADMEARHHAVWTLDTLLSPSEKWKTFTKILGKVMKEKKDDTYGAFIQCLISPFRELYRERRIELQRWFYEMMSDKDPMVRSRAHSFYSTLRQF